MTTDKAISILKTHLRVRLGENIPSPHPVLVDAAIDKAINVLYMVSDNEKAVRKYNRNKNK